MQFHYHTCPRKDSRSPEFNDTPFGKCVCCGCGAHGRESCRFLLFVQKYHTERQGEAYRWDAQLQLWTKVVTVGESETLEGAWLRREWLDVINKKMNPSVGWWCKSKHVPEELVARTQQWVKEHRGDWKKTSADLHRMGVRAEVYQPFYQR